MLSIDVVRADIAELLYLEPEEVTDSENLFEAGLDSVRLHGLIERWRRRGAAIGFADLAEEPTLIAWWALLQREHSCG
jgi:aryl carrier-like protein